MRLLILVLSLLVVSCSGLFFKKHQLLGGGSFERGRFGGLFGRGKGKQSGRGCCKPAPVNPCHCLPPRPPIRPIPTPSPPKIICGYAPSGYGGGYGYTGSGSHVGIVGRPQVGGYQTIGFKGSPPLGGNFNTFSSRELQSGVGKFKISNPPISTSYNTFGASGGISKTPSIKIPSGEKKPVLSGLGGSTFTDFSSGYGGHTGKIQIQSSLEKK